MDQKNNCDGELRPNWNVVEMHSLIVDLFEVKKRIYWLDFIISVIFGWGFLFLSLKLESFGFYFFVYLLISSFALYRALSFIHEIAHLRKNAVPMFKLIWILLIGIPLMLPTFFYEGIHTTHHQKNKYGTKLDGEYMPFATAPFGLIVGNFLSHLFLPFLFIIRFGILGPLSFLIPQFRKWVLVNISGFSIRFPFQREDVLRSQEKKTWLAEELFTIAFLWLILLGVFTGYLPVKLLLLYYLVVYLVATLNSIRTIGATHRYRGNGKEFTFQQQFIDSVNIESNRLDSLILCPVGLRFHALHHLFPGLPYHALPEAHNRLREYLPQNSAYHKATLFSVWQGWQELRAIKKSPIKKKQPIIPRFAYFTILIAGLAVISIAFVSNSNKTTLEVSRPRITETLGKVYKIHENKRTLLIKGVSVDAGDILETDKQSFMKILTAVNSEIILNQNTKLEWNQSSLHLQQGSLFAKINKKDLPSVYHLTAPDKSSIAITGTAFEWSYQPKNQNAELKVKEGVVEFYRKDVKKIVVQDQTLSASNFLNGPKSINGNSIATWVNAISKNKPIFEDSFDEIKFKPFWKIVSTQNENKSSPKNGLVCFGKSQKVELSSREIVLNHKGMLHIQYSSGLVEGEGDFEYGYELWDGNNLILKQGIEAIQTGVNYYSLKEICNLGETKDLGKTKSLNESFPNVSFHLKLDPSVEHFDSPIKSKPRGILSDITVGAQLKKIRIVFYLKTSHEKSRASFQLGNFNIQLVDKAS